ncbi:hypothetical protein [Mesorhizobium sp. M00.F.Ca.ET.216.01.1.1]|uniref:hypothetical protein n=1 Tax=Mesorhizobium sp. M00.F.Ca.ET.216.01.1.1 TaxID=2500528 RepID=UPI000FD6E9C5|nr:hypothetical protein [Mesorhizobium sp. M00.F.Ca.ET.216.01.1.1]TGQ29832.1 hypothetical protein EN859_032750 [Mesorhizobium sp. M00.F.Ca.ET.216.01.1.1]TJW41895.1 MAG: hypothetical protein E5W83_24015 [Mesorhizobium sp.]
MPTKSMKKIGAIATAAAIGLAAFEIIGGTVAALSLVSQAEARVGQPWTPRSAAGIARKHTAGWVAALPAGCVRTKINGFPVWRCGDTYYRAYQGRYIVIVVD